MFYMAVYRHSGPATLPDSTAAYVVESESELIEIIREETLGDGVDDAYTVRAAAHNVAAKGGYIVYVSEYAYTHFDAIDSETFEELNDHGQR